VSETEYWAPGPPQYYKRGPYKVVEHMHMRWACFNGHIIGKSDFKNMREAMAFCDEHERKMKEESEK